MITFTYKSINYQFRNPTIGNRDQLSFQRVNRRTRGGDLTIFRDTDWPKTEVLSLTFDFDKEEDYRRLLNLIKISIGDQINYLDHENKQWSGIIQNPDTEGSQAGLNSFQIQVLFEGDMI